MFKRALSIFLIFLILGSFFIWPQNLIAASVLRINEVAPAESGGHDWIEIYVSAGGDFSNYILKERSTTVKIFPSFFNLAAGDYVVIHINEAGTDEDDSTGRGSNGYWDLYSSDSGLIGTDNVITIEDTTGNIIDALSYSNNDGTWASAQQSIFNSSIDAGQWTGTIDGGAGANEGESVDFSSGGNGDSMGRDELSSDSDNTSIARNDWEIKSFQTMGSANIENLPPSIITVLANPSSVPADGSISLLTAQISDPDGLADVDSVFIDLSEISGDDIQEMYDDGTNGDLVSSDGIYSFESIVPSLIPPDSYDFAVTVSDSVGNEDADVLTLNVTEPAYSDEIVLSEILPNPEGTDSTDEFIELKNTGSLVVNLDNWKVGDSGSTYTISNDDYTSTEILPGGYFVIYRSEYEFALNNSGGDEVFLYQPNNDNPLDSVSYTETAPNGQSYNLSGYSWEWSIDITPGSENIITHENHDPNAYAGDDIKAEVSEEVSFDGSDSSDPDGDSLSFSWNFGDGARGTGEKAKHAYSKTGTYSVELSASDSRGGEDSDTLKVKVSESKDNDSESTQNISGPFSNSIIINEALPNPEGSDTGGEGEGEFIELYNSGSSAVDLNGWQIDDEDGGSSPHTFENKMINAGEYLVLWRSETGLALNNDADSVRLIHPDGNVISEMTYQESASDGIAYALDSDNSWKWTNTPTPGEANNISVTEDESDGESNSSSSSSNSSGDDEAGGDIQQVTIAEARTKDKNTKVKVTGVALVEPKLLGNKLFYIQDSTAGIQIYFSKEDFPEVKLGDEVTVSGKVSEAQSEKKINISEKANVEVLGHKDPPKPQEIKTGELEEKHEGKLVQISGEIAKTSGNVFYVDDGSGQAKAYIKKTTGIQKPKMEKGNKVTILGITSETSSGYRVLPRYQADLKSGDGAVMAAGASSDILKNLPQAGNGVWFLFGFSFIASLYILIPKIAFEWGRKNI